MFGYAGRIARINLTTKSAGAIETARYVEFGGGHGFGTAIFWDLVASRGDWDMLDGFNPRNIVTMMTSPIVGTLAPSASRTEVQGIGVYGYPIGWWTRTNFGGRFATQLKAAGWDGIVIEGASDTPVWVNIVNDKITIEDAKWLWGQDAWSTQMDIWHRVTGSADVRDRSQLGAGRDSGRSMQMPAVMCIGQIGECGSRVATLQHDAGSAGGEGGFGGILGVKKLKAISVVGTGSVAIADPAGLMAAREWMIESHGYHVDRPRRIGFGSNSSLEAGRGTHNVRRFERSRIAGCQSCFAPCRRQFESGSLNDSQCVESSWYRTPTMRPSDISACVDLAQQYGVNARDTGYVITYLKSLQKRGLAGPGRRIDATGYDFDRAGSVEHCRAMLDMMAGRKGIGADLADGLVRAAKKWGTLDADLADGTLPYPQWGYREHHSSSVEYFFGSLFADRDVNEHDYLSAFQIAGANADQPAFHTIVPPDKLATMLSEVTIPYTGDPFMFDFNYDVDAPHGVYSKSKAKYIAWQRHYSRFWKQSILYCDWLFSNLLNSQNEDYRGFTPDAEPKFFNAVTGSQLSFADGMETGRKIWNMDRAIWVLQGRTRAMEKFAPYVYTRPLSPDRVAVPVYNKDGTWTYGNQQNKQYNEAGVERMKTNFYELEGWDVEHGWPTRATLEPLQLGRVADVLASKNKMGK